MIGLDALRRAKEILKTEQAIADAVGVKQPSVHGILNGGKRVPAEWCIPLERATTAAGETIPRAAFRPDIYPGELPHERKSRKRSRLFHVEHSPAKPQRQAVTP